ncbi:MAG: hypothetical protein KDK07_11655 [Bauldia sp.]|nr:hypothetical protein [Bauldia sp.]
MRPSVRSAIIALAVAFATPAGAAADTLLDELLVLIPDARETTRSGPVFSYVDVRAVEQAGGVATPDSEDAFADLPRDAQKQWLAAMGRVMVGPPDVLTYPAGIGRRPVTSREALGIDWFGIDAAMTFWAPPSLVTVIAGAPDFDNPAVVGAALAARGFEVREVGGFDVWHRFDDDQMMLGLDDRLAEGDFLLGNIPRAGRVAVRPEMMVHATNWPAIEAVAATNAGESPVSPAASLSRTILDIAAETTGAQLLQATALMLRDVGSADDPGIRMADLFGAPTVEQLRAAIAAPTPGPRLPLYPLAVIADMQAGGDQLAVIGLPFPDRESADTAAVVLADRLADWRPEESAPPLVETVGGGIETAVIDGEGIAAVTLATFVASIEGGEAEKRAVDALPGVSGGSVVIATLRYPMPPGDRPAAGGAAFRAWINGVHRRTFTPLAAP